jgi:hypothetical protein
MGSSGEVRIAGTEGASQPLFSPDGRWLAFLAQGKLRKVPAEGGLVIDLAEVRRLPAPMGGTWDAEGRILLGSNLAGLFWVPAEGGRLQVLTTVDPRRETGHLQPFVLPGGRALLFTTRPHPWGIRAQVEALVLATGERKVLVEDCADARYLPTGHLLCVRQGTLVAGPLDTKALELPEAPVPVFGGVLQALNTWKPIQEPPSLQCPSRGTSSTRREGRSRTRPPSSSSSTNRAGQSHSPGSPLALRRRRGLPSPPRTTVSEGFGLEPDGADWRWPGRRQGC